MFNISNNDRQQNSATWMLSTYMISNQTLICYFSASFTKAKRFMIPPYEIVLFTALEIKHAQIRVLCPLLFDNSWVFNILFNLEQIKQDNIYS
jgi:hypothetical protein